ncbi:hypothetical protein ACSSV9_14405 [Melioribacter sp. OK-6-Me]|uniref:hypothetical protein n=1 Tax=Melioribacter sp. OK-6-Me TaxID=3423433 RepID=UPI003EDA7990
MKELHIDLDKKKKSLPKKAYGILSVIFSVLWIIIQYNDNNLSLFNIIYSLYFLLLGISFYYDGLGKSLSSLFGGAFIDLTNEYFKIKPSTFSKIYSFNWDKIKSIKIGVVNIEIIGADDKLHKIDLSTLDYPVVIELKQRLSELSKNTVLENIQLIKN